MLEFQKLVINKLLEIPQLQNQKQFVGISVDKESFPMAIINFPYINEGNYAREDITLEIDIYNGDSANEIIELEQITDLIDQKLNRLFYLNGNLQTSIYRQNPYRLSLIDEDKTIRREQLRYICKTYNL